MERSGRSQRCTGCQSCTISCKLENGTPPGVFWTRVLEKEEGTFPFAYKIFMPLRCNHCADPPCVEVCPTGPPRASAGQSGAGRSERLYRLPFLRRRLPLSGPLHSATSKGYYDEQTPYESASYKKWQAGTAQKCTLCAHRIDKGLRPACVETCPTKALTFGDRNDPNSELSKLLKNGRIFSRALNWAPILASFI